MRVLFWGTPEFAVPTLRAIEDEGHFVAGVVTQPDRPAGRGRKVRTSAIAALARDEEYIVLQPERPRGAEFMDELRALKPDVSVVAAYGHILVDEVLALPTHGSINVHASLLPALRGAAPIAWAIARGHEKTGVTIMRMVRAMDAGPIMLQAEEPIARDDTRSGLTARLAELGAELLVEALALLEVGVLEERAQNDADATFAPKVGRDVARIDWDRSPAEVGQHVRAMDRAPGAWTELDNSPLKLFLPTPSERSVGSPGTIGAEDEDGVRIAARGGSVVFAEAQPAGRARMGASDWLRGHPDLVGRTCV
jgi:methionyl-tRNA formyltransferase